MRLPSVATALPALARIAGRQLVNILTPISMAALRSEGANKGDAGLAVERILGLRLFLV